MTKKQVTDTKARKTVKKKPEKVLVLRTCGKDMTSHGGFVWPKSGPVSAPDWKPDAQCGNGLHGLLWGIGDYSLTSSAEDALWLAVAVDSDRVVDLSGKVKFPDGDVVFCGNYADAATFVSHCWIESLKPKAGHYSRLAASGDSSQLAASGYSSQLAASGHYSRLAASGDSSQLAASGDSSRLAASGHSSRLAASGYSSQLAASGDSSAAIAAAYCCTVSAGENGVIAALWKDSSGRPRLAVGYVGENGIKANTAYRASAIGALEEVAK